MKLSFKHENTSKSCGTRLKEDAPKVTLNCTEDAALGSTFLPAKSVPKELQQLSEIVGNPHASESLWMNACIGAGNKSLVPKHNFWFKLTDALRSTLGSIVAMLTLILNFSLIIFLTAEVGFFTRGFSYVDFVHGFASAEAAGVLAAMCAALCFWMTLLIPKNVVSTFIQVTSLFFLSFALIFGCADHFGYAISLPLTALSLAGIALIKHFGKLCREHLPTSFSAAKLAQSAISVLLVPAAFTAWLIYLAATQTEHSTTYSNGSTESFCIFGSLLVFCIVGQGFALARASKSISKLACTFLAVCVQAPFFLALVISTFIAAALGIGANVDPSFNPLYTINNTYDVGIWKSIGLDKAVFMFGATMVALTLSASGGFLGALANSIPRMRSN